MSGVMLLCTDCFSKFFHRQTRSKFCNEVIIKSVTAPQLCLYTTLATFLCETSLFKVVVVVHSVAAGVSRHVKIDDYCFDVRRAGSSQSQWGYITADVATVAANPANPPSALEHILYLLAGKQDNQLS